MRYGKKTNKLVLKRLFTIHFPILMFAMVKHVSFQIEITQKTFNTERALSRFANKFKYLVYSFIKKGFMPALQMTRSQQLLSILFHQSVIKA